MSVADEVRPTERFNEPPAGGARPAGGDGQFDRSPPQDVAAEQCVLGGMLLSKDAIADVVEILKAGDFYKPAHATVFEAVLDLYGRGEPADAITVAAALADAGDLGRIGGAPYLHTLINAVPTAANAAYYARIVGERAVLRRLIEAGTRIVQLGFGSAAGSGRDVDDLVDLAQQAVYDVTERRVSEDFAVLSDLLQPTLDEIEAVGAQGGVMTGVPTGFSDLDRLLNGLHPGQLVIVAGRPGLGKALALDTPLPTPDGWTTMGEVRPGDQLLGADGRPTTILAATDVQHGRACFEVEFSDGSVLVADAEHLWRTVTTHDRSPALAGGGPAIRTAPAPVRVREIVTTEQINETMGYPLGSRPRYEVEHPRPLTLPARTLPVAPYPLGLRIARDGTRIPPPYLRAGEPQRRALLAGLMAIGGSVAPDGSLRYRAGSPALAGDVRELVASLGHPSRERTGDTVTFTVGQRSRHVVAIRPVPSVPVRCVRVDNPDHLYLAGHGMIPTHNSTAAMDFARSASVRHNFASAIFSLEMSKVEIVMRLLSAEARVPLHVLRSGQLSDDDWTKLARRMGEISEAPLFVDDTPNMNLMEIRAKARRLKQRNDLKLVVVDYLQLMSSPKRTESRQQEVAELSRGLKLLAKEIDCPVIAVSQLNRGPEQRTDKRPQLSDLRESGCLTAETRLVRADTNQEVTLGELLAAGAHDVPVWALNDRLMYEPRTLTHAFPSGCRMTYRLRLSSGKQIDATANHRFLTFDGWRSLGDLPIGGRIATARHLPPPLAPTAWPDAQVITLAHRLGATSFGGARLAAAEDASGISEEFLPDAVASLPKVQIALFLRHLWATAGSVTGGRICYPSTSRRLLDGLAMLLLRFGISTRRGTAAPGDRPVCYTLDVSGRDEQLRFLREIDGARSPTGAALLAALESAESSTSVRTVPAEVWYGVRSALTEQRLTHGRSAPSAGPKLGGSTLLAEAPGRQRLAKVAAVLDSAALDLYATNDVCWDEVAAVEPLGVRDVYDATVLGLHNFVANGIAAHNSIEQDADVVILLHRDDYYDKESPRAGEADFIVAKHRNGPTDTITVAAQLHLSRFVDMAVV